MNHLGLVTKGILSENSSGPVSAAPVTYGRPPHYEKIKILKPSVKISNFSLNKSEKIKEDISIHVSSIKFIVE